LDKANSALSLFSQKKRQLYTIGGSVCKKTKEKRQRGTITREIPTPTQMGSKEFFRKATKPHFSGDGASKQS